ncbi:MAG: hypothetical protein HZT40_20655 [Candidatus Thiothrix singaporensis]|uniref:Uncharacterized protein n=1 Tax=Candidatus Thiothrix singaporensis TaxID=2799669 RepID=A0A7L6AWV6_9GAMM|nr:MAG: hypothetical protein HZT40_20655 [Candidatus Thiothrix singaporensis]
MQQATATLQDKIEQLKTQQNGEKQQRHELELEIKTQQTAAANLEKTNSNWHGGLKPRQKNWKPSTPCNWS